MRCRLCNLFFLLCNLWVNNKTRQPCCSNGRQRGACRFTSFTYSIMTIKTLPQAEKIELIATKLMGWAIHKRNTAFWVDKGKENTFDYVVRATVYTEKYEMEHDFNPYQDWNHTHMVLDKMMEDEEMWSEFRLCHLTSSKTDECLSSYMKITKEQLMDALIYLLTTKT